MNYKVLIAATLATSVVRAGASAVDEVTPQPWFKNGQPPAATECAAGVDNELAVRGGTPNITLKCDKAAQGFVGIMQNFSAGSYLGKRVRFSALVKAEGVEGWAGLWMRIDNTGKTGPAFDNMQNRPIKGTQDWTPYSVVLDVSQAADGIFFGVLMSGDKGQVWLSNVGFDVVGKETPTTMLSPASSEVRGEPGNLSLTR
ncbi:MAG TPA: hypothetical protein VE907_11385 [Gammaproteobacteria bacterium]|nr:hypothetical protein [Gammaproteobacteria bacterium]